MTFARLTLPFAAVVVAGLLIVQPFAAHAITPDEMVEEVVGAPVYASDGHQVGKVVDVSVSDDGEVDAVRFKTGAFLGFGERELTLRKGSFTALRGAVVLDVPAEALETLPPLASAGTGQDRQ